MAREEVQTFAFPAPIFEDLGGEFDEVPDDVGAVEGANIDLRKQMVQQMAELVENGFDLAVGEQCGLAGDGRGRVAADNA